MYAGGGLDWLTPFTIFTGFGVVVLYAALGCGWLIFKTELDLQHRMYQLMPKLVIALLLIFGAVSIYTPMAHPEIAARWFSQPQLMYFSPVPILVVIFTVLILRACKQHNELSPFIYTLALVFLAYTGFIISLWLCYSAVYHDLGCCSATKQSIVCLNWCFNLNPHYFDLYRAFILGV